MSVSTHAFDIAGRGERRARRPRVGLVLGSGAARGWAHIGVIRTLERAGVRPDVVCGTSVGALVADVMLVDGALVNPVPVSLARSMGADVVIAVDLSSDILTRHLAVHMEPQATPGYVGDLMAR